MQKNNSLPAQPRPDAALAVELRSLTKHFGSVVANHDITLRIPAGSIHAIIGENGAGKSTAMKMLYGMIRPDAGEILVNGVRQRFKTSRDASRVGLGMVHQHFMLAAPHSGLDNILLGAEPAPTTGLPSFLGRCLPPFLRPIARREAEKKLRALAAAFQFNVDLRAAVHTLPVGVQQQLEILKLLYRQAAILILDEPTAVLTPQETQLLFANLRQLRNAGKTVIIITHKLREVMQLADDVTVFQRGTVVAQRRVQDTNEAELAALMVGRAVCLTIAAPPPPKPGPVLLSVHQLTLARKSEKPRLADVSFAVRSGEIVGIAGVEGNGQSELISLLRDPRFYFHPPFLTEVATKGLKATGQLAILGEDAHTMRARAVRDRGVGLVPEDRHRQGLVLNFDLRQNFVLGHQRSAAFCRLGFLRLEALRRRVEERMRIFDIRPDDSAAKASGLSGGNQQKLIIAREFERQPRLLICAQPTRGVDVGSVEFIHQRLFKARQEGAAILLVSSSLEEIIALSDRILVFYEGRIAGEYARGACDESTLGACMGGAKSVVKETFDAHV